MATQDNNPGLLSKVAKFVRNPTTDWADLDKMEPAQETEQGKQALRHMIERKRHNDGVRRREFDQLRKLRRNSTAITAETAQSPLEFRGTTGYSDLDERAVTLKKIDDIEAQMSRQWWKSRRNDPSPATPQVSSGAKLADGKPQMPGKAGTATSDSHMGFASTQASDLMKGLENAPTQMGVPTGSDFLQTGADGLQSPHSADSSRGFEASASSVFSESKMMSVDMGQSLSDPEMEEAAIRFANGDDVGAQAVLMAALNTPDTPAEVADGWAAALFDLYRGTGQHAEFEQLSMDYAQRFGRSAPTWYSTPQILGLECPLLPATPMKNKPLPESVCWTCPAELNDAAVAQLRAFVNGRTGLCRLDWHQLQTILPSAAEQLSELFAQWCKQPLTLCFDGVETIELLLQACTPMGDSSVPSCWWQLRLDALRLLRQADAFELVALDFCVTYELSPPSWVVPRGELVSPSSAQAQAIPVGTLVGQPVDPTLPQQRLQAEPELLTPETQTNRPLALSGDLLGDLEQVTTSLQACTQGGDVCVVSCAQLIRVDFSAAGSLLNWVATVEAGGGHIEFREVPRLVAAFFNLIGINEHARVSLRTN